MRRRRPSPIPPRHGLDAARLRTPSEGHWATLRDHLVDRLPRVGARRIDAMFAELRFHGVDGPLGRDAPFVPDSFVWFHRDLPDEIPVPFDVRVIHQDENLLVVDKPHFLSTIPRGSHVLETALVKLRRDLGLPQLSPAHRLDRMTAGVVMFVVDPARRGAYQTLFRDRRVFKEYEAIAPYDPALELPRTVRSRIVKERGVIAAYEVEGEPNAQTEVELIAHRAGLGRYRLVPTTGRTHQLRLHMHSLGVPILGDQIYPTLVEAPPGDFTRPLQLLAKTLEFIDPLSGAPRRFVSERRLLAWDEFDAWNTSSNSAETVAGVGGN